ncbi:MAG: hypothetical protein EPN93_08620, partial [Spirochaetes bacterium]
EASSGDILAYLETVREEKPTLPRATFYQLTWLYRYLLEEGEILVNPMTKIELLTEPSSPKRPVFTEDEVRRILNVPNDSLEGIRDRAIVELFYSAGLRMSELTGLDVDDVDFHNREIFVRHGKGGKERIVPVGEKALVSLERYMTIRERFIKPGGDADALFLNAGGRRIKALSVQEMIRARKAEALVFSPGGSHALRRSMASHLLAHGAPIYLIQRMLGHEHLETTEKYARACGSDLRDIHAMSHPRAKEVGA